MTCNPTMSFQFHTLTFAMLYLSFMPQLKIGCTALDSFSALTGVPATSYSFRRPTQLQELPCTTQRLSLNSAVRPHSHSKTCDISLQTQLKLFQRCETFVISKVGRLRESAYPARYPRWWPRLALHSVRSCGLPLRYKKCRISKS